MKKSTLKRMTLACLSAGLLFSASAQEANVSHDTKYNGHCYKLFNNGMTWEQAKAACERQGGHLVTITSSQEQAVIENLLRSRGNKNNYWLGAYRNGSSWAWVTGERFSYTHWSGGQPDNFRGRENRLSMYRNRNPRGYNKLGEWNDSAPDGVCNNEPFFGAANFGYICEWDSDPNTNSNNSVDGRLKGDVNGDGKVDKSDADMLNQYIVGLRSSIPCPKNADMNSDGRHTLTDVSKIEMLCKSSSNVNSADGRMKGDVNGDGKVDKSDADMLSEYIQGNRSSLPCPKNADANGDGRITVADVTKIVSMNPTPVKHDPQGRLESCQPLQNAVRVTGYAYDEDNMSHKVRVHVYIDGTAGNSNVPSREIIANKAAHNGHGFDDTIQVPAQWCGRRTVRLYALNGVGSGTFQEIGAQVVDIPNATPQTKTAWINTQSQNLNMRAGAGQNYGIIGKLAKGTQVTVLEELSNGWAKISVSGRTGYVSSQYLTFNKPVPNNNASVRDRLMVAVFNQSGAYISCDWDGYKKIKGRHAGIDMVLYHRAPVYAAISGTVTRTGISDYNTFAIYDQNNNKTVVYLHFDSCASGIKVGDYVKKGTLIGYQGTKGAPGSSHVHVEVRDGWKNGAAKSKGVTQIQTSNPYPYWEKVL